ncbi:zinc ABC transporter substrate-binding protein [Tropicibacter sp. S64]|uniref:zinc ABC transporter substrate-binding protein n=1 Tax=Tropicibacter sp. S64 TaxID=3415122 RepID=UPI003C7C8797
MSRNLVPSALAGVLLSGSALADVPRVAVDIAPVHALVAQVMAGVGEPSLIVSPGASPHEFSLRPSQAGALQDADVVVWVSPDLTPWLGEAMESLAQGAVSLELLETDGTVELPLREGASFEAHEHGGDAHDTDHDDENDHDHDHDHGHGTHDPHAWLSPDNGAVWLDAIATVLAQADPEHAAAYAANAEAGKAELAALKAEIDGILAPVRGGHFIVFHDAYQYFEAAFDMPATGAISLSDAARPSPARIAEIRGRVAAEGVTCVLSEPQFDPGIVAAVMDGSGARTGVLDPMGSGLEPGPGLYGDMLRGLAVALAGCL